MVGGVTGGRRQARREGGQVSELSVRLAPRHPQQDSPTGLHHPRVVRLHVSNQHTLRHHLSAAGWALRAR